MVTATINREYNALPWYGAVVIVFEFASTFDPSSTTIETATRGFTSVRACLGFDNAAKVKTDAASVSANGTLVTIAGSMSTLVTLIVIGR